MSFSSEVKEELSRQDTSARYCRLAELVMIIGMCGRCLHLAMERYRLRIHTENVKQSQENALLYCEKHLV